MPFREWHLVCMHDIISSNRLKYFYFHYPLLVPNKYLPTNQKITGSKNVDYPRSNDQTHSPMNFVLIVFGTITLYHSNKENAFSFFKQLALVLLQGNLSSSNKTESGRIIELKIQPNLLLVSARILEGLDMLLNLKN